MPKKSAQPSQADMHAAAGGVASVDKALSLLGAFTGATPVLTLTELAVRVGLYKSTVLRLLASLEHAGLVHRQPDGAWRLGGEVARLHQVWTASFSLEGVVMPVLRRLVDETRESAAFHVRQGDRRLCLHRIDSPQPVRDHHRAGDLLPLERGAGGRVLLAFSGAAGEPYARIRREQVVTLVGDRVPELAGVSAPVFGPVGLAGALTLTMPAERLMKERHAPLVLQAARQLTALLGGAYPEPAAC